MKAPITKITAADLDRIERDLCAESLLDFASMAFRILEPESRAFVHGWVLQAICEHLEAVTNGEIRRLLINVPPGCMKSLLTRVFWPAWEWGPRGMPGTRTIGASYSEHLSLRDNMRMRRVIQSPWYRGHWGHLFDLAHDQNSAHHFANTKTGWMLATSVEGVGTGERGDRFVIDDPHNVKKMDSEAERRSKAMWFREVVPTRLNDPDKSAIVVIMQRVHEQDVSGIILDDGMPYEHLILPMRYEAKGKRVSSRYTDPRSQEGELLWPERFPEHVVDELENSLKEYGTAGQLQQRPAPRGGGMFPIDKFKYLDAPPPKDDIVARVRYWDKAASEDATAAHTAGVLMLKTRSGKYVVADVRRGQWSALKREQRIRATAEADGYQTSIWIEQEPGSGGKDSAQFTVSNLSGFRAKAERVTEDKGTRAEPYSSQVEAENVYIVRAEWNQAFLNEHETFPRGKWKDQVDAAAGAFSKLAETSTMITALGAYD